MNPKFRGWGYVPLVAIIAAFLILRPLFEHFLTKSEDYVRHKTNVAVLLLTGIISLVFVGLSDRRTGTRSFAFRTWTRELSESYDITFYIPTRIVGVVLITIALVIDVVW